MKKVSFVIMNIFVFLLGFGCSLLSVNATTIAEKHVCTSNSEEAGDANTCNDVSISSKTSIISIGNEDPECIGDDCDSDDSPDDDDDDDDVCKGQKKKPFDILFLIDNSGSMTRDGKYPSANKIFRSIFRQARKKVKATKKVNYILFNNFTFPQEYSASSLNKGKDILTESNVVGSTYIQGALKNAGSYFKKKKYSGSDKSACDDNTPVLVLLTDGYPTVGTASTSLTGVPSNVLSAEYHLGNYTSAKYAYYVLENMYALKKSVCNGNLKIITIGLEMDEDDPFANYMLNPSYDNYLNLPTLKNYKNDSARIRFSEATRLREIVSNKQSSPNESIATLSGASEYGLFRGRRADDDNKIIFYDVDMTKKFLEHWQKASINFDLLVHTKDKSEVSNIKYFVGKTSYEVHSTCYSTTAQYRPNHSTANSEVYFKITLNENCSSIKRNDGKNTELNGGKINGKNITKIQVTFKSKINFSSYKIENERTHKDFEDLVDVSKIGTAKKIGDYFEEHADYFDVKCKPSDNGKEGEKETDVSDDYMVIGHTLCTEETFNVDNYYIKTSDWKKTQENQIFNSDRVFTKNPDGSFSPDKDITRVQCVPVTLKIPVVVFQDNVSFSVGSLRNGQTIYRGGGISFDDVSLKNRIKWEYAQLSNPNRRPVFNITSSYYMKNESGKYKRIFNIEVDDDIPLYVDENCTNSHWYPPEEIAKKILTNMGYSNSNWTFKGEGSDLSGSMVLDVSGNSSNIENIPSTRRDSYNYPIPLGNYRNLDLDFESNFYIDSFINKKTAEVVYKGSNPDGTLYDDAGSYYYTPLDYKNKTINVKINSAYNFANYPGVNITFKGTCPVTIDQVDPTPPGGGDDDKYGDKYLVYRPIDVENPFPHSSNKETVPINWRDWYCGSDNTCSLDNLNKKRIAQSYQHYPDNPLYSVTLTESNRGGLGNQNYNDWSNIDASTGKSVFISPTNGFLIDHSTNSYCGLGRWNVICDIYS